jgi:hypothetical protein
MACGLRDRKTTAPDKTGESDGLGGVRELIIENRHNGQRLAMRRVKWGDEVLLELKGSLPPHQPGRDAAFQSAADVDDEPTQRVAAASSLEAVSEHAASQLKRTATDSAPFPMPWSRYVFTNHASKP